MLRLLAQAQPIRLQTKAVLHAAVPTSDAISQAGPRPAEAKRSTRAVNTPIARVRGGETEEIRMTLSKMAASRTMLGTKVALRMETVMVVRDPIGRIETTVQIGAVVRVRRHLRKIQAQAPIQAVTSGVTTGMKL